MRASMFRSYLAIAIVFLIIVTVLDSPLAEEIHVVGNAGYRYLDGEWTQTFPEKPGGWFTAIFALSENDIYIGCAEGYIYYYNGSTWEKIFDDPPSTMPRITSIWGSSNDNIYFAGFGNFRHYNGSEWTEIVLPEPTTGLEHFIYGFSADDIYVVGRGSHNYIYHCDGIDPLTWEYVDISSTAVEISCGAVWGNAGDDVYIAGDGGQIIHWDGIDWELIETGTTSTFYDIWGTPSGELFAVSYDYVHHFDGTTWTHTEPPYSSSGHWIWVVGSSASNVLIGGSRDEVVHYDGSEWAIVPGEEVTYSHDAFMFSSDFALIPDAYGRILMYDGTDIEICNLLYSMPTFNAVSCSPSGTFYAAGDAGYVFQFDDSTWIEIEKLPEICSDIIAFADDDICVLSGGCVYRYDGGSWNLIEDLMSASKMWGSSSDDLYVMASDKIHHYDGVDWTVAHDVGCVWECPDPGCETECCHTLYDLWGLSDYCIHAVGCTHSYWWHATTKIPCDYTLRVSYDGTDWIGGSYCPHNESTDTRFTRIGGSSSSDIWIDYSTCGDLIHFNGSYWQNVSTPFCGFSAMWGKSPDNIYFLDGNEGDIYLYNGVYFSQVDLSDVELNDVCGVPGFVATVLAEPIDPVFTIDGVPFDEPFSFISEPGAMHEIGVESPQLIGDVEYNFAGWSDSGDTVHTITLSSPNEIYIAHFLRSVKATVTTEPEGLDVIVEGTTYASPCTLSMINGDEIEIGTISPQRYKGADYYFVEWSDGGARTHHVTLPAEDVVYTAIFTDVLTGIEEPVPLVNALHQNHPNPFNPMTTISFSLRERGRASLAVYNVAGRLVRVLQDDVMEAGPHEVTWDGRDREGRAVASGVYFYRLETGRFSETKKMVQLR